MHRSQALAPLSPSLPSPPFAGHVSVGVLNYEHPERVGEYVCTCHVIIDGE